MTGNKVIDTPGSNEWVVIEATSVCPDGVPIEYRSVTISVPFGPFGSKLITSTSAYMDTENGVLVAFQAPMGLHGRNQYRIVENENGDGLLLREEAALTGVSIMMPFVMGQERESHTKHRMNIAEELGKRASAGSKDAGMLPKFSISSETD